MANLGCIELNPWSSRLGTLDKPDYVVLDLDPVDASFDQVIETAQTIRKILEKIEVEASLQDIREKRCPRLPAFSCSIHL